MLQYSISLRRLRLARPERKPKDRFLRVSRRRVESRLSLLPKGDIASHTARVFDAQFSVDASRHSAKVHAVISYRHRRIQRGATDGSVLVGCHHLRAFKAEGVGGAV
jgi:hypothetical protein